MSLVPRVPENLSQVLWTSCVGGLVPPEGEVRKKKLCSGRVAETTRERAILGVKIAVGKVSDETLLNASPLF